jgi:hypothetical protein
MSDTLENEMQPSETVTPQELCESLLTELEIARQLTVELSNEQLEEVVGGGLGCFGCKPPTTSSSASPQHPSTFERARSIQVALETVHALSPSQPRLERTMSTPDRFQSAPFDNPNPVQSLRDLRPGDRIRGSVPASASIFDR